MAKSKIKIKKTKLGQEIISGLEEVVLSLKENFRHLEVVAFKGETYKHLKHDEHVLYLGLIPNVPGHCAVAKHNGEVLWLVHPEDFRRLSEDEL